MCERDRCALKTAHTDKQTDRHDLSSPRAEGTSRSSLSAHAEYIYTAIVKIPAWKWNGQPTDSFTFTCHELKLPASISCVQHGVQP